MVWSITHYSLFHYKIVKTGTAYSVSSFLAGLRLRKKSAPLVLTPTVCLQFAVNAKALLRKKMQEDIRRQIATGRRSLKRS